MRGPRMRVCTGDAGRLVTISDGGMRRIVEAVEPYQFDQIYGAWFGRNIKGNGKQALRYSADRYIAAIGD